MINNFNKEGSTPLSPTRNHPWLYVAYTKQHYQIDLGPKIKVFQAMLMSYFILDEKRPVKFNVENFLVEY